MKPLLCLLTFLTTITLLSAHETESTSPVNRVFEMRTYHTHEGKLEDLHARFRNHTNALFVKHGMSLIGYWTPEDQPETLVYILAYPSKEAREKAWKGFIDDPEWKAAFEASRKDGPLVKKVESSFLQATDYSPIH